MTDVMVTAARWFVASPLALVGGYGVVIDPEMADGCAVMDNRADKITAQCVEAVASVLESAWLDIKDAVTAPTCACTLRTAVCVQDAPWGTDERCVIIPDNTTTADQLCYGPCEHVAVMLGVATAVVAAAGGAAYTLRDQEATRALTGI